MPKRPIPIYPFLLAAYPVLALWAHNIAWVPAEQVGGSIVVVLAGAATVFLGLRILFRDTARAAWMTGLGVLLFFSYGQVYEFMKSAGLGATVARHRYLAPLWLGVLTAGVIWALRRPQSVARLTPLFNVIAASTWILPGIVLAGYALEPSQPAGTSAESAHLAARLHLPQDRPAPDVYLIIVDAYARADMLQQVFNYDNTKFISSLRALGFYVPESNHSNYGQTSLSVSSILNMDYVDQLLSGIDPSQWGRKPLWELIQHSEARRILEGLGYQSVAFSTSLPGTEIRDADLFLTANTTDELLSGGGVNAFERMLIETSAARLLLDASVVLPRFFPDLKYPYRIHRARVLNILDHLETLPRSPGPKFVFAHIISPHPPFIFGPNGEPREDYQAFTLAFTFGDAGAPISGEEYLQGYRDQVHFLNQRLETILPEILQQSTTPPIILIMGDHGPEGRGGGVTYTQERMSNFMAVYLPDGPDGLYDSITPVNAFRIVFNEYFGGAYELLPDRVLYSEYRTPFQFDDITEDVY